MISILITDPDQKWSTQLQDFLSKKNFKVDVAMTGKEAQLLVYKNKYHVIILDMQTVENSSLEVLRYLKLNAPEVKVIVTMEKDFKINHQVISIEEIKKLGASFICNKPCTPEKIFKSIGEGYQIGTWKDIKLSTDNKVAEEVKAADDLFTRIKFENFFSGSTTIFDYYIRLGQNKFVKILHKGEAFEESRLKQYENAELKFLYFRTSDRSNYINYTSKLLEKIIGTNTGTTEKKLQYTQSVVEKYLEQVHESGLQPNLIDEGKSICLNMYGLIQKEPTLHQMMKSFEEYDSSAYSHSFLVSFFSIVTCKNLEWSSARTVELVALGGLFHNIGKLKLPPSLKGKNSSVMSKDELLIYHTHPQLGAEMLSKCTSIPAPVRQIVQQHHEFANGEGYPNQLNNHKIYPPAKIVCLTNEYVKSLFEMKLSPLEGLKTFMKDRAALARFDPLILKALVSGFIKEKS